MGTFEPPELSG